MTDILIKIITVFFAIYGFIEFLRGLFDCFCNSDIVNDNIVIAIKVKNSEEILEGTVRMIIRSCLSVSHGGVIPDILIVDMGSTDHTPQIAKYLCNDYVFIDYITYNDYVNNKKEWFYG